MANRTRPTLEKRAKERARQEKRKQKDERRAVAKTVPKSGPRQEGEEDPDIAGITPGLASLLYAHKLLRKAASVGLDPGDAEASLTSIVDAAERLRGGEGSEAEHALGDLLAAAVAFARTQGIDAESSLRGWSARYKDRFEAMEHLAVDRGLDLHTMDRAEVESLWAETLR